MNIKNNIRHKETMKNITSALVSLLQNKSLKEISVTDICETAKINRSTFYEKFSDLPVLSKAFSEEVEKQAAEYPHNNEEFSWVFDYVKANKDIFTAYFKVGISEIETDYKTIFFRNGVYSVIKLWFEEGCKESSEQMSEIVLREYRKCFKKSLL